MTLLIGYDDTSYGRDALALGLQIAGSTGETPTVVTAYPDDERGLTVAMQDYAWITKVRETAERKLDSARAVVGDRSDVQFQTVGPSSASRGLHELAEKTKATALVVGSSEHGAIGRLSLGSTVERLLHGAPCPVVVAPRGYRKHQAPVRNIAVAYDGSPESQQALGVAVEIAQRLKASLRLVAVAAKPNEQLQSAVETAARAVPADVMATGEVVVDSDVVETLADLPGDSPDLLVCGSRGYGPTRQVLLGGVSNRVIRSAAYPVIVVPRSAAVLAE